MAVRADSRVPTALAARAARAATAEVPTRGPRLPPNTARTHKAGSSLIQSIISTVTRAVPMDHAANAVVTVPQCSCPE